MKRQWNNKWVKIPSELLETLDALRGSKIDSKYLGKREAASKLLEAFDIIKDSGRNLKELILAKIWHGF